MGSETADMKLCSGHFNKLHATVPMKMHGNPKQYWQNTISFPPLNWKFNLKQWTIESTALPTHPRHPIQHPKSNSNQGSGRT